MKYFLLTSGEDGTRITETTPTQLARDLDGTVNTYTFIDRIPDEDKGHWYGVPDNAAVLIKGEIVRPLPQSIVTQWFIP